MGPMFCNRGLNFCGAICEKCQPGNFLKSQRKSLNLSLLQAAEKLGCSKPHLHDIENGYSANPSAKLLNKFREIYGLDAELLLDLFK